MKKILVSLIIILNSFAIHFSFAQDHGHLYVGATSTNQGAPLLITNAADFVTDSGYVKTLSFTNGGKYAGYFDGNITFEAKPAYNALGDPVAGSAALGAWVHAQIVSVDGPVGGGFGFWEAGALAPTFNIPCGTISTNTWALSNNGGAPGTDPFGHIHGRRFTATKPGIYTVAFKALDRCTNGTGGGPIHTDSDILKVYFQAGINISSITRIQNVVSVRFGSLLSQTFYLESNDNCTTTNWNSVGSVPGNDNFQTLTDTNGSLENFYRIRVTNP
ncbi:MAG: hypothetical protein ABIR24_11440 [Verrucomicrobiota bacterium]